ncbi:MAG: glycosyltransferase, partial [Bacteroidota bacterium]
MARISIVTGAHLCRNPRVVKEATALAEAGHDVTVLGPATDETLTQTDAALTDRARWSHRYVVDIRPQAGLSGTVHRVRRRLAVEAKRQLNRDLASSIGYGMGTLLTAARNENADLTIGHQEVGTWVCAQLANEGFKIGVDVEDWYSRHPHPSEYRHHPIALLETVERQALRHAAYAVTTSHALANGLAEAYGVPPLDVVYNAFPWAERASLGDTPRDRPDQSLRSLHWVSQTIGPNRGLDDLFDALRQVRTPVQVHLRGHLPAAHEPWLHSVFPSESHRLHVHDLIPPGELLARIAEHDIGIALEISEIQSRDLTVTNKILHYLLGGLAVIASRTSGQAEIASHAPDAVTLVDHGDVSALASAIDAWATDESALTRAQSAALDAARRTFSWEKQAPVVVSAAAR